MVKKKDIGKVFKEQLKGFEQSPDNISWKMIESQLDTDQGPNTGYWTKFTILIIFLSIIIGSGTYVYINNTPNQNQDQKQNTNLTDINITEENCEEIPDATMVQLTEKNTKTTPLTTTSTKQLTERTNNESNNNGHLNNKMINTRPINPNTLTYTNNKASNRKISNQNSTINSGVEKKETANLASTTKNNVTAVNDKQEASEITFNNSHRNEDSSTMAENTVTTDENAKPKNTSDLTDDENDNPKNSPGFDNQENNNIKNTPDLTKKHIISVPGKNNAAAIIDSIKKDVEEDTISISEKGKDLLKGQKKDTLIYLEPLQEASQQKWSLGLHFIPTYTLAFGNYNLNNSVANNKINGRLILNYGIRVSTPLGEKAVLRFGYNSLKLGTKTKNLSRNQLSTTTREMGIVLPSNENLSTENNFHLTQNIKYHELSSELNYYITDWKDFKISGLGGFSFLLLKDNDVNISSSTIEISDSADNLSDLNMSFNFGANIRYQLSDRIELYVDPIFKYQLFKSTKNSNDNYPLYFILQTGVLIKFD